MPIDRIFQKRSLSQVFLQEEWPLQKIAAQVTEWNVPRILEIGPGGGVLTKTLCAGGWRVTAVEKDVRFAKALHKSVGGHQDRLEIINEDILKFDLAAWLGRSSERVAIVGNIPYNISSPIMEWLLPHLPALSGACLMVQLEYAERLASPAGTKSYGSLSVYTQLQCDVDIAFKIERTCFRPVPKVDSAVICLTPKKEPICDKPQLAKVEMVSRLAFQQRRKKLSNSIERLLQDKDMANCPIDLNRRPDNLTPQEYVALAAFIFES